MNTRYRALLRLIIDPVVWNVAATSGMALSTVVEEMGDNSPHHDKTVTIRVLRCAGKRSYGLLTSADPVVSCSDSSDSAADDGVLTSGLLVWSGSS